MDQKYKVCLTDDNDNKIHAIMLVREFKGLGLAEAKNLVETEQSITLASKLTLQQAEKVLKRLTDVEVIGEIINMDTGRSINEAAPVENDNTYEGLKCPKCGCGFIEHLVTSEQTDSGFVEKIRRKFAKKYECRNCGFTWK